MSPKRWSCTHFFLWSTTISFSGFMVQVGRKSKNLSIIDRTWNMNKHILKPHVMVHTNLHLNAITFWFERTVVRLKNLGFQLFHMNLHIIHGTMGSQQATKVFEHMHNINRILISNHLTWFFKPKFIAHKFMHDQMHNGLPNNKLKHCQYSRCTN